MGEGKPLTGVSPKWEGCQWERKIESKYGDRFVLGLTGPSQVVSEPWFLFSLGKGNNKGYCDKLGSGTGLYRKSFESKDRLFMCRSFG